MLLLSQLWVAKILVELHLTMWFSNEIFLFPLIFSQNPSKIPLSLNRLMTNIVGKIIIKPHLPKMYVLILYYFLLLWLFTCKKVGKVVPIPNYEKCFMLSHIYSYCLYNKFLSNVDIPIYCKHSYHIIMIVCQF